jgi:hypothetical protein
MRNIRLFLVLTVILSLAIWWYYFESEKENASLRERATNESVIAGSQEAVAAKQDISSSTEGLGQQGLISQEKAREHAIQQVEDEWRAPVDFYGRVVDETGRSISGAAIHFSLNGPSGTEALQGESDVEGYFSLTGKQGKQMSVTVSKEGYYSSRRDRIGFRYAGDDENFVPDSGNPIIFHLQKEGEAEPLIHIASPIWGGKGFRTPRDGTPVEISLITGNVVPLGEGNLRVECWTYDQGKHGEKYDWKCRISVPGGGLIRHMQEFPFLAPLSGYQPSDEIDMSASLDKGWSSSVKRDYFVRLADGKFARVNFEMIAGGDHFFLLESFLNPSGSRNLEFDGEKRIVLQSQ